MAIARLPRHDLRTRSGREAADLRRAIGTDLRRTRLDAHLSIRTVARAAAVTPGHLSEIERGATDASLAVLTSLGHVLGATISIRLFPGTGARIHDRLQAPIVEALLRETHSSWKRLVEVPVWRPARGVIDAVLAQPGQLMVATEVHSEITRLEQLVRWSQEKAASLPSAASWSLLSDGKPAVETSRLLVVRSTKRNRDIANAFEATLRAAYPGAAVDALAALRDPASRWPGPAVVWADVRGDDARLLERPPRSVRLGR